MHKDIIFSFIIILVTLCILIIILLQGDYSGIQIDPDATDFELSVMDGITISCEQSVIGGYYLDPDNYDWITFPYEGEGASQSVDLYFGDYQNKSEYITIEVSSLKQDNYITVHWYSDSPWKLMIYSTTPLASDIYMVLSLYHSRPFTDENSWWVEHFHLYAGEGSWERDLSYNALGIRDCTINGSYSYSDLYYNYSLNLEGEN